MARQISLSQHAARLLRQNLEAQGDGYSFDQTLVLHDVARKINGAIGAYNEALAGVENDFRPRIRDAQKRDAANLIAALVDERNELLEDIVKEDGATSVTIVFTEAEFGFVDETLVRQKNWSGAEIFRQWVIEFLQAVRGAEKVKVDDGAEDEAPKRNGRSKVRDFARAR